MRAAQSQMPLPLHLPHDMAMRAHVASQMLCEHMRCSLSRSLCIAYQMGDDSLTATEAARLRGRTPPHCRSGECRQGIGVLLRAGVLEHSRCPTCHGCGRVPRERQREYN
jgi:hypothetical protein